MYRLACESTMIDTSQNNHRVLPLVLFQEGNFRLRYNNNNNKLCIYTAPHQRSCSWCFIALGVLHTKDCSWCFTLNLQTLNVL